MDLSLAALLAQDGLTNGAIYALLALALVLVFAVTRVILVPAGEYLTIGTLTLAAFDQGRVPGTVYLVIGGAIIAGLMEATTRARRGEWTLLARRLLLWTAAPAALAVIAAVLATRHLPLAAEVLLSLALTAVLGPLTWRIVFQPIADASVLVLLIVGVAVHFVLTGLGLYLFGAEGSRTPAFSATSFTLGAMTISVQSVLVIVTSALAIIALYLFFGRTLAGKALHATAVNRLGARLCGISPDFAGALTFALAALLCAFCGVLVGPITTVYYDSGFLISLKGFVGAIIGGLVSYPAAAAGALLVGIIEAYSSFWASAFKEVIVFTLIIPVLLWRSLATRQHEEDE